MTVEDFRYDIVHDQLDPDVKVARIEGRINGQLWAALVPPAMVDDQPACESWLRHLAEHGDPNAPAGIEVVG